MPSTHLVDPELAEFLKLWPLERLSAASLAPTRFLLQQIGAAQTAEGDGAAEERMIPGAAGQADIRLLIHRPPGAGVKPAFLHVHGGGFVMGAPEFTAARDQAVAAQHDCVVIAPAYRLAPEHPYPAALDDCYAALKWLHDQADALGTDRSRIVIGGESAGGGLAAALALLVRDRGEMTLAGQLLTYPMLDDRTGGMLTPALAGDYLWTAADNQFGWASYLPCPPGSDAVPAYAAPARASTLAGLPPTIILTGALDLFRDENLAFVQRLTEAGVPAGLTLYPGAFHGFDLATQSRLGRAYARDYDDGLAWLLAVPA